MLFLLSVTTVTGQISND